MEVYDHAIDQYINRVMGLPDDTHNMGLRQSAKEMIKKAVEDPKLVYHEEQDMPQIHIRDGAGVVVGVRYGGSDSLQPYDSKRQDLVVPTVYNSNTFLSKNNETDGKTGT